MIAWPMCCNRFSIIFCSLVFKITKFVSFFFFLYFGFVMLLQYLSRAHCYIMCTFHSDVCLGPIMTIENEERNNKQIYRSFFFSVGTENMVESGLNTRTWTQPWINDWMIFLKKRQNIVSIVVWMVLLPPTKQNRKSTTKEKWIKIPKRKCELMAEKKKFFKNRNNKIIAQKIHTMFCNYCIVSRYQNEWNKKKKYGIFSRSRKQTML